MSSRALLIVTSFILVITLIVVTIDTDAASSTLTTSIASGADDVRMPAQGGFETSRPSELIGAGDGVQPNVAGFRFTNITIPRGSVITGVQFSMVKDGAKWQRLVVNCAFVASDNVAPLTTSGTSAQPALTQAQSKTDNNVRRTHGKRYDICKGGQLVSALQEVIDRSGWRSGNAIALVATGPAKPAWARQAFFMSEAGANRAPQLTINYTPPSGVPATNTPTATATNTPTATATSTGGTTPPAQGFGQVNLCGEGTTSWHPPVVGGCQTTHEHGDAPPSWVLNAGYSPSFTHHANTPNENVLKHTGFKGFAARLNGIDVYIIMHLDTTPNGHTSRFHSYQMWARDPQGGVSHWHGWLDFGEGNSTGPNLRRNGCDNTDTRPIMAVRDEPCNNNEFESWYARAGGNGGWAPDFGFNMKPQYYTGGDPNDMSTWVPTGSLNDVRRFEVAWYADRTSVRGLFWATQFGNIVSGPNDPVCGTTRTFGSKSYPVLCLEQNIASTMPSLTFPGNSNQKEYNMNGVALPN